jgi:hypothetical protein
MSLGEKKNKGLFDHGMAWRSGRRLNEEDVTIRVQHLGPE